MTIDITSVKITDLAYNPNHPIKLRKSPKYFELLQSIKENELLQAVKIRKLKKGYEVIDGRLRVEAYKNLEFLEIPAIIENMDDDTAILQAVNYNLYRDDIFPSEYGFMFRLRMEAMNRQGKQTELTCGTNDHKLEEKKKSRDDIGEQLGGKSGRTVSKYIRLTYLTPKLLELVDSKKLTIIGGADLSYLREDTEQQWICKFIDKHSIIPNADQCKGLKEAFKTKKLTLAKLDRIMNIKDLGKPQKVVFDFADFAPFFDKGDSPKQIKAETIKILTYWKNNKKT